MASSDAFALKNSGLNEFLLAEVGTEMNGFPLTILSVLARLGKDPWAEAAQWAKLPKAAIIDRLADSIGQMPLPAPALIDARATAARLIKLLPTQSGPSSVGDTTLDVTTTMPKWLPIAAVMVAVALGIGMQMFPPSAPPAKVVPLTEPVVAAPNPPTNG